MVGGVWGGLYIRKGGLSQRSVDGLAEVVLCWGAQQRKCLLGCVTLQKGVLIG